MTASTVTTATIRMPVRARLLAPGVLPFLAGDVAKNLAALLSRTVGAESPGR